MAAHVHPVEMVCPSWMLLAPTLAVFPGPGQGLKGTDSLATAAGLDISAG